MKSGGWTKGEFERCLNIYSEVMQKGKYSLITLQEIEKAIKVFEQAEEYEKCSDLVNYIKNRK